MATKHSTLFGSGKIEKAGGGPFSRAPPLDGGLQGQAANGAPFCVPPPFSRINGVMEVLSIEGGLYLGHPTTRIIGQLTHSKNGHSRNPNFCVGCFELIIIKIFAMASKMGENILFLQKFLRNPILIHFVATARDGAHLGLWDCSPFLHSNTNVDSGTPWTLGLQSIAQISTNKHDSGRPVRVFCLPLGILKALPLPLTSRRCP